MPDVDLRNSTMRPPVWQEHWPQDHTLSVVAKFGDRAVCQLCGTVCMADHTPRLLRDNDSGREWIIPGAYVGPPDDPHRHLFPFGKPDDVVQDTNETEPTPKKRPASIPADAAKRSDHQPSRTPEARHREYIKRKRRRGRR